MTDISHVYPQVSPTITAIVDNYKKVGDSEKKRGYLGMSIIGHPCSRYLWYDFRFCCREDFDGRMYRLFETGDLAESRFCKNLRDIGCTVYEVGRDGKQFECKALGGHFLGHLDAVILGIIEAPKTWHDGEFKTHDDKSFKELKVKGVKLAKPMHYCQMQCYMKYCKLTRAFYMAVNKDTDELYGERVRYNAEEALKLEERALNIITASTPPARIGKDADDWRCRFCSAKSICWGSTPPEAAVPVPAINCRQCIYAKPEMDTDTGRWSCTKHNRSLSNDDQARTCKDHLFIPDLITFANTNDSGLSHIEYLNRDGKTVWQNGSGEGQFSSKELTTIPYPLIDSNCMAVKQAMAGTVVRVTYHLDEYSEAEVLWRGEKTALPFAWEKLFNEKLSTMKPIRYYEDDIFNAAEFTGDRLACVSKTSKHKSEIRKGKT